jgi:phenylpropionate dioxygenase-like ring-hydroxylating dioxygenase large terminal subunit
MKIMSRLLDAPSLVARLFDHIDNETTDLAETVWREPVANYRSQSRLEDELALIFRKTYVPFCPSAALPEIGSFIARDAAGVPLLVARGTDGVVRGFRNACRHRGAQVACGAGRQSSFTCKYHGWTYDLEGGLRKIPHEYGFPDLKQEERGLVPVANIAERGGLVFIQQEGETEAEEPTGLPDLLGDDMALVSVDEMTIDANWKIHAESFLEGYHIRSTHRETFYPVQYDNLNAVEYFGRNARVTFPFRNIEKLRGAACTSRDVAGTTTQVYHLFPNVLIATFLRRIIVVVLEPISLTQTRQTSYTLAAPEIARNQATEIKSDTDFVAQGTNEDRAVVEAIQRSINSDANAFFEFGLFEGAISHFHRNLHEFLDQDGKRPLSAS